ncbi:ACT domain-containing protein [Anaerocolumna sp. AGMB13025]|uniref:ACT domain-containing protein n=1 Tax=Anaerocolumna sp. AGMB13025 TaxID=3039116 RepID=UPI00241C2493|nr:ACT domain-containing protein [Anaerocolumna sp. AGMB13025]WFR56146.1 ACT domain-containing protein [Anaerocolumna sp. AGMB13025]
MLIKQLSVFIENRAGRLEKVTETMDENNINIISASLADTSEYGIFRLIVSEPERARTVLKESGFSANLTDVIAVKLPHKVGMLHQLFKTLAKDSISVEYMYALSSSEIGSMILKVSDVNKALETLRQSNFDMLKAEEAYSIN